MNFKIKIFLFYIGVLSVIFGIPYQYTFSNPEIIFYINKNTNILLYITSIFIFSIIGYLIEYNLNIKIESFYKKFVRFFICIMILLQILIFFENYFYYPGYKLNNNSIILR